MSGIADLLKEIRNQKWQRHMAEQMGDIEFQMDVAPYLNYKGPIDPAIAKLRTTENPDDMVNTMGVYARPENPPEKIDVSMGEEDPEYVSVMPGTVNVVNPRNARPNIWGHEYRHLQKNDTGSYSGERDNRLVDAFNAQNTSDFREAADGLERSFDIDTTELIQILREMADNKPTGVESTFNMEKGDWVDNDIRPYGDLQPYLVDNPLFMRLLGEK